MPVTRWIQNATFPTYFHAYFRLKSAIWLRLPGSGMSRSGGDSNSSGLEVDWFISPNISSKCLRCNRSIAIQRNAFERYETQFTTRRFLIGWRRLRPGGGAKQNAGYRL